MTTTGDPTPDLADAAEHAPMEETLAKSYRLIADWFVNPERLDRDRLIRAGRETVVPAIEAEVDEGAAATLRSFLDGYETFTVDEYVETHELSPTCPLYLGHYGFDQPETCRDVAGADRNQYMVELNAIYGHYGFEIGEELPDFLPAMVEFWWLTLPERGEDLRTDCQRKALAILEPMRERFEVHGTPYRHLLSVLIALVRHDVAGDATTAVETPDPEELSGLSLAEAATAEGGER